MGNSLLTNNSLGFAIDIFDGPSHKDDNDVFYFASERSEKVVTYFHLKNLQEKQVVVAALVAGKNVSLLLNHGELSFEFDGSGRVVLSWDNREGRQTVTFNEIALLQLMDLHWVRTLVLSRRAGYL